MILLVCLQGRIAYATEHAICAPSEAYAGVDEQLLHCFCCRTYGTFADTNQFGNLRGENRNFRLPRNALRLLGCFALSTDLGCAGQWRGRKFRNCNFVCDARGGETLRLLKFLEGFLCRTTEVTIGTANRAKSSFCELLLQRFDVLSGHATPNTDEWRPGRTYCDCSCFIDDIGRIHSNRNLKFMNRSECHWSEYAVDSTAKDDAFRDQGPLKGLHRFSA